MRLGPSDGTSFARAEAGVEVTPGLAPLDLGIVNAFLIGEVGGPWVLVDTGTPGNIEKIRAEAQERFGTRSKKPRTRSCWAAETTGPISTSSPSARSAVLMVETALANSEVSPSYTLGPAMTREAAVQSCPEFQ